jgi:ABC-2 type transport system ATP-binding protein
LLLLDEPAASLDPLGRRDVLAILERLRETTTVLYSTHILDDVQRVSDSVGILDRGALVADGAIDELLAGGTSYLVRVSGDAARAAEVLRARPWVAEVGVGGDIDVAELTVAVTDAAAAENELLRTLAGEEQVTVTEFRKRTVDLEDVFVQIVEGGRRDGS